MAEEGNEEVKQSKSGKGLMIVLVVLIVILLAGLGFLGYIVYDKVLNVDPKASQEQAKSEDTKEGSEFYKAAVNDLVLNITNAKGREKLMKLSFSLKSTEPSIEAIVEEYKPEIVDVVIAQISSRSSEELLTVGGKNLLKDELISDINNVIDEVTASNDDIKRNSVQKILFTSFVIK
jgi:flagellar FliL protein